MTVGVLRWREMPNTLRWRGPDFAMPDIGPDAPLMAIAAIVGAPGQSVVAAASGGSGDSLGSFTASATMPAGTPVVISRLNGMIGPADAAAFVTAAVIGTIQAAVEVGFAVAVLRGPQMLADWTAVAGTAALLPGQTYFLAAGGGITTTVPAQPGAAALTRVGIALSPQILDVDPLSPLLF